MIDKKNVQKGLQKYNNTVNDVENNILHMAASLPKRQGRAVRYTPRATHIPAQLRGAAAIPGRR
jgi:hypothetical protein